MRGAWGGSGSRGGYQKRKGLEAPALSGTCACGGSFRTLPKQEGRFLVPGSREVRCDRCGAVPSWEVSGSAPRHNPKATPRPTAEQARVLRLLVESGENNIQYRKGGFWTAPSTRVSHQTMGVDVPLGYTAPGTLKAMERRGWLARHGSQWNTPFTLTPEGRQVTELA